MHKDERLEARISGDFDDKSMFQAINLLRSAGFQVSSAPVEGGIVDLWYGSYNYFGLKEIKKFVDYARKGQLYYPRSDDKIVSGVSVP
jgi:hypothetical protein